MFVVCNVKCRVQILFRQSWKIKTAEVFRHTRSWFLIITVRTFTPVRFKRIWSGKKRSTRISLFSRVLSENDRASPQTKKAITSNSCYDRYMLQYPQTLYPTSSLGYQRGTGVTTTNSVIKSTYTKSDDHVKNYHTDDGRVIKYSSAHTSNVAMTTANSDHPAGVQICLPSSDIHPAFRLYPYTQFPAVFDPSYLSASYKTLAPFSALQGMVVLPSSFMQVPLSSNGMDKNSGGIHCKNADSIEICNTWSYPEKQKENQSYFEFFYLFQSEKSHRRSVAFYYCYDFTKTTRFFFSRKEERWSHCKFVQDLGDHLCKLKGWIFIEGVTCAFPNCLNKN